MFLSYTLLVTQPPYGREGGSTAFRFAREVVDAGHRLDTVFFYQDGVQHANMLLYPATDEVNLYHQWCDLASDSQCRLLVCVSAAERRGVIGENQAKTNGWTHFNIESPFVIAGLSELAIAMQQSDRFLQL
ncbi:MAG: Sulfurtransferase TusD [Candidatus Celerinatantimonas neptuna]|nr:MAG: Sulfurtransferase TusD [Candidatus Celerinatantimonas neptuna]